MINANTWRRRGSEAEGDDHGAGHRGTLTREMAAELLAGHFEADLGTLSDADRDGALEALVSGYDAAQRSRAAQRSESDEEPEALPMTEEERATMADLAAARRTVREMRAASAAVDEIDAATRIVSDLRQAVARLARYAEEARPAVARVLDAVALARSAEPTIM